MRVRTLVTITLVAVAASPAVAFAKPTLHEPIPVTAIDREQLEKNFTGASLEGLFTGLNVSGYSAGVLTVDGSVGYNFNSFGSIGGHEFYAGVEGSLGLQLPTDRFEAWGAVKAGPEIAPTTWAYGRFAVGSISGTPVVGFGGGVETGIGNSWSVYSEFMARRAIASTSFEYGVRGGLHYYFDSEAPGSSRLPDLPQIFDASSHTFYVGTSVGFVPTASTIIPSLDFGVNCAQAADLDLGLRGRVGVQLSSSHAFELWGGGQVGFNLNDQAKLYGFGEFGTIGGGLYNSIGAGGEYRVAGGWGLYGEGFSRGALGTATEFGGRVGLRHYFEPIDSGH
jgi:hypothetical protein